MEDFSCQFCEKKFSTKGNLNNHVKKAKYCIEKRCDKEKIGGSEIKNICEFCGKYLATRYSVLRHLLKCKQKVQLEKNNKRENDSILKDQEIEFLKKQLLEKNKEIEYLTHQLSNLALEGIRKPTVINSNTSNRITNILTPLDLNEEKIKSIVENNLDETYFLDSQDGIARFCFDNFIKAEDGKRKLICSDPVRERYRYMDNEGVIREDIKARNFIKKISKPIIESSKKVHGNLKDKYEQIKEDIKRGVEIDLSDFMVEMKEKYAEKCMNDIRDIPYDSTNKKFRKELAIKSNI